MVDTKLETSQLLIVFIIHFHTFTHRTTRVGYNVNVDLLHENSSDTPNSHIMQFIQRSVECTHIKGTKTNPVV